MLWNVIAVICIVVAALAGYVYWQYRTAAPPALGSIPIYAASLAVPLTDLPEPQRRDAEAQLRNIAAGAYPGYEVGDERFLATKEPFTWDALRHRVEGFLYPAGYVLDSDGTSSDNAIMYHVYGHAGGLRRKFNTDMIMVAALDRTPALTATADAIHIYGYFRLTPG